jgi:hypothetical protein
MKDNYAAIALSSEKGILLNVRAIDPKEVAKGIARISIDAMDYLGVNAEDAIVIMGTEAHKAGTDQNEKEKKWTVVKCLPMTNWSEDENDAIKLDGLARNNAGAWVGDSVLVKKATVVVPAKRVVFKVAEKAAMEMILTTVERDFKRIIFAEFDRAYVSKGDMLYPAFLGVRFPFIVDSVEPKIAEEDENVAALMTKGDTIIEII